jgi:hypothetical protein
MQTKMKLIVTITFMFIALSFAFKVETSDISNERGESNNSILMDIIQSVLNDPEYFALSSKQQLHVLIVMYNIMEDHLQKQRMIGKQMR